MNGADLLANDPFRGLIVGFPGGGKTGCLAALLNVGYKVRMLNFEGLNYRALVKFTDPKALKNLDVMTFSDKAKMGAQWMETSFPSAFKDSLKAMTEWKYTDPKTKKEVNLGKSADWGSDTVVVLDSMTSQGEAAFHRMMGQLNRTPGTIQKRDWGFVVNDQIEMLRMIGHPSNRFHFIVLAHLQMITPEDIEKNDDELTKDIKREIGSLISSKMFPKAVTRPLSMQIAKEFPTVIQAKQELKGNKSVRYLYTTAGEEVDLKVPALDIATRYPIETGLADIFEAMGYKAPGLK